MPEAVSVSHISLRLQVILWTHDVIHVRLKFSISLSIDFVHQAIETDERFEVFFRADVLLHQLGDNVVLGVNCFNITVAELAESFVGTSIVESLGDFRYEGTSNSNLDKAQDCHAKQFVRYNHALEGKLILVVEDPFFL